MLSKNTFVLERSPDSLIIQQDMLPIMSSTVQQLDDITMGSSRPTMNLAFRLAWTCRLLVKAPCRCPIRTRFVVVQGSQQWFCLLHENVFVSAQDSESQVAMYSCDGDRKFNNGVESRGCGLLS